MANPFFVCAINWRSFNGKYPFFVCAIKLLVCFCLFQGLLIKDFKYSQQYSFVNERLNFEICFRDDELAT